MPIPWPQKHPHSWRGLILWGEALIIPTLERENILQTIHEEHIGISKWQNRARHSVYWPGIISDIKWLIESCPTCQCHCLQESWQLLQATPAPECPWQLLSADYFHFDGSEYLVVTDYYSKMPIIRRMPASQCHACKTISVLKDLFAEHGIQEVLCSDSGPQLANALFTKFATDWKFDQGDPGAPWPPGSTSASYQILGFFGQHCLSEG